MLLFGMQYRFKQDERPIKKITVKWICCHFFQRYLKKWYLSDILSKNQCSFLKVYNVQHCLLDIKKKKSHKNKDSVTEFIDLSINFNCIPHELIIEKVHVHKFRFDIHKAFLWIWINSYSDWWNLLVGAT